MLMQFTKKSIRPLDEKLNAFGPEAPVGFIVMRLGYMCTMSLEEAPIDGYAVVDF